VKITKKDSKVISEIVESAKFFRPTPDQRHVKAEFHSALIDGPTPKKITAAFAVQLTGRSVIEKWWSEVEFRKWFIDSRSFDNRAEALANSALETIGDIMMFGEREGDRLAAAKTLIEIAGKVKKNKVEVQFLDENIPDDPLALDEYIQRATNETNT
jgi:hypothetical protein